MGSNIRAGLILSVYSVLAISANAATVQLEGDTVTYEYDNVTNAAALTLFGMPTIVGDTVRFAPPNFKAQSIDGIGINTGTNTDSIGGNFIFDRVFSNNGLPIAEIKVTEFGDYEIVNGDSVSLDLLVSASNNNNFAEFTSAQSSLDVSGDTGGLVVFTVNDVVATIFPAQSFATNPNDILITIQNTLTAVTNAQDENAFIQKKLSFVATVVPIPASVWLLGSALGLLGVLRRRTTFAS